MKSVEEKSRMRNASREGRPGDRGCERPRRETFEDRLGAALNRARRLPLRANEAADHKVNGRESLLKRFLTVLVCNEGGTAHDASLAISIAGDFFYFKCKRMCSHRDMTTRERKE